MLCGNVTEQIFLQEKGAWKLSQNLALEYRHKLLLVTFVLAFGSSNFLLPKEYLNEIL